MTEHGVEGERTVDSDAPAAVTSRVERAREATAAVADYDQADVDELVRAVGWAVHREDRARELAATSVAETGMGTESAKFEKLRPHLRAALAETLSGRSVGTVEREDGVIEVLKPVGVVGALVPSTNPASTTAFLAALAVKGRNAIVVSPPSRASGVVERTVEYVRAELAAVGAPPDLVQALPSSDRPTAECLLERVDLAHVTGSASAVEAAQTVGTPNYCAGAGNATAVVDETADLETAARALADSVSFDNGAVCTSESNVVVDERVRDPLLDRLAAHGGRVCSPAASRAVLEALFEDGERDPSLVAADAAEVAAAAGLSGEPSFLVVDGDCRPDTTPVREKLTPVVAVHAERGFDAVLSRVRSVLSVEGAGHGCVLHTDRPERAESLGRSVDVCRAVVNQPGARSLPGRPGNGLAPTYSLGAGVWGGNQLDTNLTYRQFLASTRVSTTATGATVDEETVFGAYERYEPGR